MVERFAKVPEAVLTDIRLTDRHRRVLIALLLFSNKQGVSWPSRKEISRLTRIDQSMVSVVTGELESLGWIVKTGKGGRSRATRYSFRIPPHLDSKATHTPPTEGEDMAYPVAEFTGLNGYQISNCLEAGSEGLNGYQFADGLRGGQKGLNGYQISNTHRTDQVRKKERKKEPVGERIQRQLRTLTLVPRTHAREGGRYE